MTLDAWDRRWKLRCDAPGCYEDFWGYTGDTPRVVLQSSCEQGWISMKDGACYCRRHKMLADVILPARLASGKGDGTEHGSAQQQTTQAA